MPDNFKIKAVNRSTLVAVAAVVLMFFLILLLPAVILDGFIAVNLGLSLLILLSVLFYPRRVMNFRRFPNVLLWSTLFGLILNIASTRFILSRGAAFDGRMIRAFSGLVIGNGRWGWVIGAVTFISLL